MNLLFFFNGLVFNNSDCSKGVPWKLKFEEKKESRNFGHHLI